jgi:hypothetical protein
VCSSDLPQVVENGLGDALVTTQHHANEWPCHAKLLAQGFLRAGLLYCFTKGYQCGCHEILLLYKWDIV